jgi:hypothetical protein
MPCPLGFGLVGLVCVGGFVGWFLSGSRILLMHVGWPSLFQSARDCKLVFLCGDSLALLVFGAGLVLWVVVLFGLVGLGCVGFVCCVWWFALCAIDSPGRNPQCSESGKNCPRYCYYRLRFLTWDVPVFGQAVVLLWLWLFCWVWGCGLCVFCGHVLTLGTSRSRFSVY